MNAFYKTWGLGLILLAVGCDAKNAVTSGKESPEKPPTEKELGLSKAEASGSQMGTSGSGEQVLAVPRTTFKTLLAGKRTVDGRDKFLMELQEAATKLGKKATDIAAELVLERPTIEEKEGSLLEISCCFPATQDRIDLYGALKQADLRMLLSLTTTQELLAKKDEEGLSAFYEALPVGRDRTRFSADVSESIVQERGMASALDYISALEMPEEQFSSLKEVVIDDVSSIRVLSKKETEGIMALAAKLPAEQKAVIDAIITGVVR